MTDVAVQQLLMGDEKLDRWRTCGRGNWDAEGSTWTQVHDKVHGSNAIARYVARGLGGCGGRGGWGARALPIR